MATKSPSSDLNELTRQFRLRANAFFAAARISCEFGGTDGEEMKRLFREGRDELVIPTFMHRLNSHSEEDIPFRIVDARGNYGSGLTGMLHLGAQGRVTRETPSVGDQADIMATYGLLTGMYSIQAFPEWIDYVLALTTQPGIFAEDEKENVAEFCQHLIHLKEKTVKLLEAQDAIRLALGLPPMELHKPEPSRPISILEMRHPFSDEADDKAKEKLKTFIDSVGGSQRDVYALMDIVSEMSLNHQLYDLAEHVEHSSIAVTFDLENTGRLNVVSRGVINTRQYQNLASKVAFVRYKSAKELWGARNKIAAGELNPEEIGPVYESKGGSMGTITIAASAGGPVTLKRGKLVDKDHFLFMMKVVRLLDAPLRITPIGRPKAAPQPSV